jgi:POT family proton-dependent oligopeptide transporter
VVEGAFLGIMLCAGILKFLGVGVWLAGVLYVVRNATSFYFTQDIFGDIGLKPTAASKRQRKAAAENTPVM